MQPTTPFDHIQVPPEIRVAVQQQEARELVPNNPVFQSTMARLLAKINARANNNNVNDGPITVPAPTVIFTTDTQTLQAAMDPLLPGVYHGPLPLMGTYTGGPAQIMPMPAILQAPFGYRGYVDNSVTGTGKTLRSLQQLQEADFIVDEKFIRGLLTRDFVCRKIKQWPLLTDVEMQNMLTFAEAWIRHDFKHNRGYTGDIYIAARRFSALDTGKPASSWSEMQTVAINRLDRNYPHITALLEEFHGRLIAAGGAVSFALHRQESRGHRDIDLFFIDPQIDSDNESPLLKQERATALLLEVISFLVDQWLNRPDPIFDDQEDYGEGRIAYVFRGEFVTTVFLADNNISEPAKFQFIHRVYPNLQSILGGFDLGPAMIAYTGRKIVATELGAWSAMAKTIIVDTSRRSTSFEHRLTKYGMYCHIVFPGLAKNWYLNNKDPKLCIEDVDQLIHEHIANQGFCFARRDSYCSCCDGDFDLIRDYEAGNREVVIQALREKAAKHGYEITAEIHLIKLSMKESPKPPVHEISSHDFRIELAKLAYRHGYRLDIETFFRTHKDIFKRVGPHIYPLSKDSCDSYLRKNRPVFRLPKLEINCDRDDYYGRSWNVRPNQELKYELTSDYDGNIVAYPVQKLDMKSTDYDESPLWPEYMIAANFTSIKTCHEGPAPVVSICCFKNAASSLPLGEGIEDFKQAGLEVMKQSAINLDVQVSRRNRDPKLKRAVKPREMLKELLLDSINNPQLGDFTELYIRYNRAMYMDESVRNRMENQYQVAKANLMGIRWIVKNPGTQWTSSINPIIEHPKDWYGQHYRSFRLGDQELESYLRLMRLRPGNPFSVMPKDVFKMILVHIFMAK